MLKTHIRSLWQVMFRGDSHQRQLYATLKEAACPEASDVNSILRNEDGNHVNCFNSSGCRRNLSGICLTNDFKGDGMSPTRHRDLLVNNFGLQNILHMETLSEYSKLLDAFVADLQDAGWGQNAVWHDINAVAHRKDAWTLSKGQPQTNIKIAILNANATRRFKALGYPIIPSFSQTLALTLSTRDVAHYIYKVLQQSTMQFVLGLLCPGN